jgi:hypothetical protein
MPRCPLGDPLPPRARLRQNSDQPTAITNVLVNASGSTYHSGEIPLGTPTCSARSRRGRWALYPGGEEVVVVWPGGALTGPPAARPQPAADTSPSRLTAATGNREREPRT